MNKNHFMSIKFALNNKQLTNIQFNKIAKKKKAQKQQTNYSKDV